MVGGGLEWGDQPDWSPGSESGVSHQVSVGLGFPIWNVGVFDETENSAGGKVFGVASPGNPSDRLYRTCCLPGGQTEGVTLQGHSLGHPSPGPVALALSCLLVLRLQRNLNPPPLLPELPTCVGFTHSLQFA